MTINMRKSRLEVDVTRRFHAFLLRRLSSVLPAALMTIVLCPGMGQVARAEEPGQAKPAQSASAPARASSAVSASGAATDSAPAPLATVNGVSIPASALTDALRAVQQPDTPALRETLKTRLVNRELLRQAAAATDAANAPEVAGAVARAHDDAMIGVWLGRESKTAPVTEEAVGRRYATLSANYGPFDYRPRIISVSTAVQAKEVLRHLRQGRPFDLLAAQYSVAPNAAQGGLWPWTNLPNPVTEGNTNGMPFAIAQVLTHMKVGQVSRPINVDRNLVIVRLEGKRASVMPPYEQIHDALRVQMENEQKRQAEEHVIEALRQHARIE
ncbi:peptidylprolyl isomerase [Burkholderia glumae]|uniref:peptidylprolyl isomerase n=1 Tax=Burkholderia glumae TaxID=337 RepID=UPI0021519F29|nr:peptidylprolyl isomerase [Burkholderia glumae]UVS82835.1 peptidyl-prolyl cis-trans isomerase [Burkholderia glumae]